MSFQPVPGSTNQWYGEFSITGSLEVQIPTPREIVLVECIQKATATPGTDHITHGPVSGINKDKVTIYTWLNNAASVAASDIMVKITTR